MKKILFLFLLLTFVSSINAQFFSNYSLYAGVVSQKTQKLYWENGVGADFTSDYLLDKKIHLKIAFVTSRLGSALGTNAIPQASFTFGADWRFFSGKPFQIFAGLNAGFFKAHYGEPEFDVIPSNSPLVQFESGLVYNFEFPLSVSASFGYNFLNSNGEKGPGTLFPLFYQMKAYYRIK